MFWILIAILALVAAGVAAAAIWGANRAFALRLGAALLALAILAVLLAFTWKHLIVATALTALVLLGLTVMSGKMAPGRAFSAALGALFILFGATWLAVQLGDTILFHRETTLSLWIQDAQQWLADFTRPLRSEDPVLRLAFLCFAIFGGAFVLRSLFGSSNKNP